MPWIHVKPHGASFAGSKRLRAPQLHIKHIKPHNGRKHKWRPQRSFFGRSLLPVRIAAVTSQVQMLMLPHSCSFLAHFQEGDKDLICLDQAASDLGVERRRIYDVVNILEALEVVSRKEKNWYHWHGLECLPDTMQYLRNAAIYDASVPMCDSSEILQGMGPLPNAAEAAAATETARSCRRTKGSYCRVPRAEDPSDKRERSMGALAQRFLQLFLVGRSAVTLEYAADCLMEGDGSAKMKTRVRRLYDIANVLCMLRVVAKDTIAGTRKPVFRWIGTDRVPDFTKIRPPTPPRRAPSDAEQRRASALTAAAAHGRDAASVRAQMAASMGGMQLNQQQMLAAMAMQQQRHAMLAAIQQQQQQHAAAAAAAGSAPAPTQQGVPPPGYTVMMVAGPNGPTPMLVSSAMLMQQMINMQAARGMMQQQQQQQRAAAASSTEAPKVGGVPPPAQPRPVAQAGTYAAVPPLGKAPTVPAPRAPTSAVGPPESLLTDPGFGPGGVRNVVLSAPHPGGWCILPGVVSAIGGGGGASGTEAAFPPLQVATARTTGRGTGVDMGTARAVENDACAPLEPAQLVAVAHPAHSGRVRVGALRYHPAPAGRVATTVALALTDVGQTPPPAGPTPCAAVSCAGERGGLAGGVAISRSVMAAAMRLQGDTTVPARLNGGSTITGNSSAKAVPLVVSALPAEATLSGSGLVLQDARSRSMPQDDELIDDAATDTGSFVGVQGGWMAPDAAEGTNTGGTAIYGWSVPVPDTPLPARRSASSLTGGSVLGMSPAAGSEQGGDYHAGAPPTHCASTVKAAAGRSGALGAVPVGGVFMSPTRGGGGGVNSAAEVSPYVGGVEGMPMGRSHSVSKFLASRREAMSAAIVRHERQAAGRMATVAGAGSAISSADAGLASTAGNGIHAGFTPLKGAAGEPDNGDGMAEFLATAKQIQQDIATARAAAEINGTTLGGRATGGASARRQGRKRKSFMSGSAAGAPPRSAAGVSMLNFNMFSPAAGQDTSRGPALGGGIATSASLRRVAARTGTSASPGSLAQSCTPQRFLANTAATPGFTSVLASPDAGVSAATPALLGLDISGLASPPRRSAGGATARAPAAGEGRSAAPMLFMSPFASTVAFRVDPEDDGVEGGGLFMSPVYPRQPRRQAGSGHYSSTPRAVPRALQCADVNTTAASLTLSASTGSSSGASSEARSLAASVPGGGSAQPTSAGSLHSGAGDISHIPSTDSSRAQSPGRGGAVLLSPIPSMNLSARLEQAASTAQRKQRGAEDSHFSPQDRRAHGGGVSSLRRRALSQAGSVLDETVASLDLQTEVA